jgi:hypothetical protein
MPSSPAWQGTFIRVANSTAADLSALAHALATDLRSIREGQYEAPARLPDPQSTNSVEPEKPLKVFVSWAHSDEDWSADQSLAWERRIIAFTTILRSLGIDADVDLYHGTDPSIDWTRFGQSSVLNADFVIIVNSKGWGERWSGTNSPTVGAGAVVETDTLKGLLAENQAEFQRKTLLVRLPGPGRVKIPSDLNRLNRFSIDTDDTESFEPLIRMLTGQPSYAVPELGAVPTLPSAVTEGINMRKRPKTSRAFSQYEALRSEVEKLEESSEDHPNLKTQKRLATLLGLLDALQS